MRVIAGKLKGRQLASFQADHIRPTTDRMKESIFNILRNDVPDSRVLDLFSGTGNMAIEAWSRGATQVECVESHRTSLKIIRDNLKTLKIEKDIRVHAKDAFAFLENYQGPPYALIFLDPPFTEKIAHKCMPALAASAVSAPKTLAIIESAAKDRLDDIYGPYHLLDRREFGDKRASIFKYEGE